ncbi:MAG: dihydropteroate synthase [Elusimicrobium sp.]|jgi:dihydropteroate synthase|nr:dihydropteroate synthase [Elusimicrobium sp.]
MKRKPIIMGILNITPDSFFDGGVPASPAERAAQMIKEGAAVIDIGGESTRPGALPVSLQEEEERVLPALRRIRAAHPQILISVDTYKPALAAKAAALGADILNDPSGLSDVKMAQVAAAQNKKLVIMHARGTPQTMNKLAVYNNILEEIKSFFEEKIRLALAAGVRRENIILDPGFGFAKTKEQNLFLLENLEYFKSLNLPLLVGLSRKRFLSETANDTPAARLPATLEANKKAAMYADILRVHDVAAAIAYLNK